MYIENKKQKKEEIFPDYVNKIKEKNYQKKKMKEIREMCQKYFIDEESGRLRITFNISSPRKYKRFKTFFIVYQIERINILYYFFNIPYDLEKDLISQRELLIHISIF